MLSNKLSRKHKGESICGRLVAWPTLLWKDSNQPLIHSVCRDLELRFIDRNVEVCVSDQWHAVVDSAVVNNITPGNIMSSTADSTSVTVVWTPPPNLVFNKYDVSCTNENSGQIHTIKVADLSADVLTVNIRGLMPATDYTCCITVHTETNLQIDTLSMTCTEARTLAEGGPSELSSSSTTIAIGLGAVAGFCILLLIVSIGCGVFLVHKYRKNAVYVTAARLMWVYIIIKNAIASICMVCMITQIWRERESWAYGYQPNLRHRLPKRKHWIKNINFECCWKSTVRK